MIRFLFSALLLLLPAIGYGQEDFSKRATGYKPLTPEKRRHYQEVSHAKHGGRLTMMAKNQALPPSFDARDKVPLPVWNQANCGSCYLIATVRTATCTLVRNGWGKADNSFKLSLQFGMDRPRDFGGCDGGNGTEVIAWMCKNGWPAEIYTDAQGTVHTDYPPYEAQSGRDRTKPGAKLWMKDGDWGFVNANGRPTTEEIKAGLFNYGRLNISLDAGGQFGNIGNGMITSLGSQINHEINMVAYDDNKKAFLLENQWDTTWGNNGCAWVTYAAARQIVDIFFVTASVLPPVPPPPPLPPDPTPTPGKGDTITLNIGGKETIFQVVPGGSKYITPAQEKVLREIFEPSPTQNEPPIIEKKAPEVKMPEAKTSPISLSDEPLTYAQGMEAAMQKNSDLLVYVGLKSKPSVRAVVCETPALAGFPAKCVVISRPHRDGYMEWMQTIDEYGKVTGWKDKIEASRLTRAQAAVC